MHITAVPEFISVELNRKCILQKLTNYRPSHARPTPAKFGDPDPGMIQGSKLAPTPPSSSSSQPPTQLTAQQSHADATGQALHQQPITSLAPARPPPAHLTA